MAQYYASIQGNRGEATRMGTKASGISGHIRGWNVGCRVKIRHIDGKDKVFVYKTSGSNGAGYPELITAYTEDTE